MRLRLLLLSSLAFLAAACAQDATGPGDKPAGPGIGVQANISGNKDTLTFTLRWGRAPSATSYDVNVTVDGTTNGPTTGLPANQNVTDTTITFKAVNTTYDSLAFHATVASRRGTLVNATPAAVSWSYVRRPGPPGQILVDSSANSVIYFIGLDVHANHVGYENFPWPAMVGEITRIDACAYFKFSDGTVAEQSDNYCMYNYRVGYPESVRGVCTHQPPLWNPDGSLLQPDFHCAGLPNAKVQAWVDAQCIDWSSSDTTSVTVDTPSCPTGTNTQVAPVINGASSIITATLRGYGHKASIKLGWDR